MPTPLVSGLGFRGSQHHWPLAPRKHGEKGEERQREGEGNGGEGEGRAEQKEHHRV